MSDEPTNDAAAAVADPYEGVHALYVGETRIWMPDLDRRAAAGIPRCCTAHPENEREAEHEAWLAGDPENGIEPRTGFDPRVVVEHGDVLVLDRHSATQRSDFEEIESPPSATKAELMAEAEARGIDLPKSATKAQILEALNAAPEGESDAGDPAQED